MIFMYNIYIYTHFLHTAYVYNGPSFYQKFQDNVICTTKTRRFQNYTCIIKLQRYLVYCLKPSCYQYQHQVIKLYVIHDIYSYMQDGL